MLIHNLAWAKLALASNIMVICGLVKHKVRDMEGHGGNMEGHGGDMEGHGGIGRDVIRGGIVREMKGYIEGNGMLEVIHVITSH